MAIISNNEWMTVARNSELRHANWLGGNVNNGCMKIGNTRGSGGCSYDGANPEGGAARNTLARLELSSGSQVWDFSGNLWEWVDFDELSPGFDLAGGVCDGAWHDYTDGYTCGGFFDVANLFASLVEVSKWRSDVGTGGAIRRGSHFDIGSTGDIFTIHLVSTASSTGSTNGFRCSYRP